VRNRTALLRLLLTVLVAALAALAPYITPHSPLEQNVYNLLAPPGGAHLLGTDDLGRDVLARILTGARVSLTVGVCSVLIGTVLGSAMGLVAGYSGGRVELLLMRIVDLLMSFPALVMGLMFMAILGPGMDKLILAIGFVLTPQVARIVHGSVVAIRQT
jgi:ABC-type dipeptide/oligopeptide/nickel transport system permease subunit